MAGGYRPGMVTSSGGLPTLVVWVGTNDLEHARVLQVLSAAGYATTGWAEETGSDRYVVGVHLINQAAYETPAERDAVCRHLMAMVQEQPDTPKATSVPVGPPELKEFQRGDGWARYKVLVACGSQVDEAEFERNQHGWYCDRIGWEFRWYYPVPDGGPERDGAQMPAATPREAAMQLLRKKHAGNLYLKILLDEFPPLEGPIVGERPAK